MYICKSVNGQNGGEGMFVRVRTGKGVRMYVCESVNGWRGGKCIFV